MAVNYLQATLTPNVRLTDELQTVLTLTSASLEPIPGEDGTWYVYWEDGVTEPMDWDDTDTADLPQPITERWAGKNLADVLRAILDVNPDVELLTYEAAMTCSKLRQGEFGGGGIHVTRKQVAFISSADVQLQDGRLVITARVQEWDDGESSGRMLAAREAKEQQGTEEER